MSLQGKVAVVTGSGRGLGLAYAQELARQGAAVVVNDVDEQVAAQAVDSITAAGGQAEAVVAPVGSTETAQRLVQTAVDRFGRLDILVTNAGVLRDKSLLKMTDEDFDLVINVHLRGTFTCVREAYAYFKANDIPGRIIAIGSPTGQRGNFGQTNYAAAKAGIVGMVRTWALETRKAGVCVNAVIPVAATAMTKTVPYFAAAVEADEYGQAMPDFFRKEIGFGTAQDVAGLIGFLASDEAAGITGQVIGAGGDRIQIWSHPEPVRELFHDGGWSTTALVAAKQEFLDNLQGVGEKFPSLPTELQPIPHRQLTVPYELGIDVDAVQAIDTHVHVEVGPDGHCALPQPILDAATKYFRATPKRPGLDEIAEHYRAANLAAVVFTVDASTFLGHPPNSSVDIAEGAARNNDVLIPFGSVDPLQGAAAIEQAKRLVEQHGVRGFKFHPSLQNFNPSDRDHYPLYEVLSGFGLPVIFHTGQTGIGAGAPGGFGIKLSLSNPMLLDTVAADFPDLTIIMAHPSVPWQDEAIAIATHKTNVYIDLSGWSPKYFPPQLVRQANSQLQDKVMFGSDFPLISPERWLRDFAALDLKDTVRPKILKANAQRVLGLTRSGT